MKMKMELMQVGLSLALAAGVMATSVGPARADGAWLDAPLQNWNQPGQDVPILMTTMEAQDPRCLARTRPPETPEDAQVVKQGWKLVGDYRSGWGARVVLGALKFDGMCRPLVFQAFVFQDGVFAGTLSPVAMDSRTDGAFASLFVIDKAPDQNLELLANYSRYKPEDALCCPSARSSVTFEIVTENGKPLVTPVNVYTTETAPGD